MQDELIESLTTVHGITLSTLELAKHMRASELIEC